VLKEVDWIKEENFQVKEVKELFHHWNQLPATVVKSDTVNRFKMKLDEWLKT
jgi:hypothetical protein